MPTILLSDTYDAKLKKLAASDPFQTREYWVERLIDEAIASNGIASNSNGQSTVNGDVVRLMPDSHQLAHTRLLSATINGTELHRPKWNSLMHEMHIWARKELGSFQALREASDANLRQGRYEDNGYKYIPKADLSIQGVDANAACEHAFRLAKVLNVSLKVTFEWRDKAEAAYPGQRGIIEWVPNGSFDTVVHQQNGIRQIKTSSNSGRYDISELRGFQKELWELVISKMPTTRFTLRDVYARKQPLVALRPHVKEIDATIRAGLEKLRDRGLIEFVDNQGTYLRLA
jgi:hypothetical protein